MSRFKTLYVNELIKLKQKKSIIVIACIIMVAIVLISLISYLLTDIFDDDYSDMSEAAYDEVIRGRIKEIEAEIERGVTKYGEISMPFTASEKEELENRIALLRYEETQGGAVVKAREEAGKLNYDSCFGISVYCVLILAIVLFGTSISGEISSGSIKSLIIAPAKRGKIFFAKVLSIISVTFAALIAAWLLSLIMSILFFGTDMLSPYVYASGGEAHTIAYVFKTLLATVLECATVLCYGTFALMLSSVMRSSTGATGLSFAFLYIGSLVSNILYMMSDSFALKFIPFDTIEIADKVFNYYSLENSLFSVGSSVSFGSSSGEAFATPLFSAIYIAVFIFTVGFIAYDSFTRRDI